MFGSDWPVCLIAATYERVLGVVDEYATALSADERDGLFGGNAARFYGLTGEMDLELTGKVVLVTGGAKGIGAAIVRAIAAEGGVPDRRRSRCRRRA